MELSENFSKLAAKFARFSMARSIILITSLASLIFLWPHLKQDESDFPSEEVAKDSNIFTSRQFMANPHYKEALERELEREINKLDHIQSVTVHIMSPEASAFERETQRLDVSISVHRNIGLDTEKQTLSAIMDLVLASIPNLVRNRITVVDQNGHVL